MRRRALNVKNERYQISTSVKGIEMNLKRKMIQKKI